MRTVVAGTFAAVALVVAGCQGCQPYSQDVGPSDADGTGYHDRGSAGLIYQLAGDEHVLYAVSLNAGIWKREASASWRQLSNSSLLATSLAIDPLNPRHLISGDRNGEASEADASRFDRTFGGIWESRDGGENWIWVFSPLQWLTNPNAPPACATVQSAAVPVVAFTPAGTILAGTSCGIARRSGSGGAAFSLSQSPSDVGLVTALAVARRSVQETIIWALARRLSSKSFVLLFSTDDGQSWAVQNIPTTIDGLGVPQDIDGSAARGDLFSLAAFGDTAVLVFKPEPDNASVGNRSVLAYFNRLTAQFRFQIVDGANNGTGLGGRRLLRSIAIRPPFAVGNGVRVFYSAAQDLLESTGLDAAGQVNWKAVARTDCGDCGDDRDPIHVDIWDVLPFSQDDGRFWIAGDGGVIEGGAGFKSLNAGLHTHHIHSLAVIGLYGRPTLTYATSDNDAWFRDGSNWAQWGAWDQHGLLGDANWVAADVGNRQLALQARNSVSSTLTDFGISAPAGARHVKERFTIACIPGVDKDGNSACSEGGTSPTEWQVIHSGARETVAPLLDVVWLARLPLSYLKDGEFQPLSSGSLHDAIGNSSSRRVLLRNRAFAANPDINESQYEGWTLEAGNLPAGTSRVWASGGHGYYPAVYYVCVCESSRATLFKQTQRLAAWSEVLPIVTEQGQFVSLEVMRPANGAVDGPLFVDPLDPDHLLVTTTRGPAISWDGGSTWQLDGVLTALLTESGRFPLSAGFNSGNGADVVLASRGLTFMYVSDVAFGGAQLAVASPFAGVYFRERPGEPWRDARPAMPKPLPTVSAMGFFGTDLYVATEGRSLLRVANLDEARLGTYFVRRLSRFASTATLHLMGSDGSKLGQAAIRGWKFSSTGQLSGVSVMTSATGELALNSFTSTGDRLFLWYAGDSKFAPASTSF